jgi:hypothetical protein
MPSHPYAGAGPREAVASFDEVLNSVLQAGLARASVADNEDMRKRSGWVAIVAVPTMIARIYGMNFTNMPELGTRYGYFVVLGLIAAVMIGLYTGSRATSGSSPLDVPKAWLPGPGPGRHARVAVMGPPARPRTGGPTGPVAVRPPVASGSGRSPQRRS